MKGFMAEVYAPAALDVMALAAQVRSAARELRRQGTAIRYLRATLVPEDQTCLLLFEAPTSGAVEEVSRRAGLVVTRVVEAVEPGERGSGTRVAGSEKKRG